MCRAAPLGQRNVSRRAIVRADHETVVNPVHIGRSVQAGHTHRDVAEVRRRLRAQPMRIEGCERSTVVDLDGGQPVVFELRYRRVPAVADVTAHGAAGGAGEMQQQVDVVHDQIVEDPAVGGGVEHPGRPLVQRQLVWAAAGHHRDLAELAGLERVGERERGGEEPLLEGDREQVIAPAPGVVDGVQVGMRGAHRLVGQDMYAV